VFLDRHGILTVSHIRQRSSLYPTRASQLAEPWIDSLNSRADALRRTGAPVVSLGQAVPGFPPPAVAVRAAAGAIEAGNANGYTADAGIPELRAATARWLGSVAGGNADAADGLIVTAGANQAFALIALTAFAPGDDVLLGSPCFFNHEMMVRAAGATPVEAPMDPATGFALDAERILAALTPTTRAVVVVTPANPTGAAVGRLMALWRLHVQRLDADRIGRTLRLLEEALSQSDLVPAFEAIARTAGR
jgi:aspartate/methionine/tyrosine aminotransferase